MANLTAMALKLRELRKARGLTQKKLAEKIKCNEKTISQWESDLDGKRSPSLSNLKEVCKALDCSIFEFMNSEDIEKIRGKDFSFIQYLAQCYNISFLSNNELKEFEKITKKALDKCYEQLLIKKAIACNEKFNFFGTLKNDNRGILYYNNENYAINGVGFYEDMLENSVDNKVNFYYLTKLDDDFKDIENEDYELYPKIIMFNSEPYIIDFDIVKCTQNEKFNFSKFNLNDSERKRLKAIREKVDFEKNFY